MFGHNWGKFGLDFLGKSLIGVLIDCPEMGKMMDT